MINILQQQFLRCFTWSNNQLLNLNVFFFFFFSLYYLSTQFISVLTLKSSAIHWLNCFGFSSGLFLVLFWMLWMLVTVHKLCHVSYASRMTTCGTIFTKRHFSVSKEWVRSWSQAFLITYHKTLIKKLFGGPSRKSTRRKKRKQQKNKTRMAIAKLFALDANTIIFPWTHHVLFLFKLFF